MQLTPWDRIKIAMAEHGLKATQTECAKLLGIKQPSVWEWASNDGAPSVENSTTLGRELNVCVEWILTGRGPKHPGPPMEPAAQALWELWKRIPPEDRPLVVGYAEGKIRPSQPTSSRGAKLAPRRRSGS